MRLGILGATLVSVVGALALALFLSRWIEAPIRSIAAASLHLASGDFSRRVAVAAGGELGETAHAFNVMAERIETLQTELRSRVRSAPGSPSATASVPTAGRSS